MTAPSPGGRDVADDISGPPPTTKRHDVPLHWVDNPAGWWSHVAQCSACAVYFEQPHA